MEENARLDLVRNLATLYNDVWDDEGIRGRLIAEPRPVLAEHGIQLPAAVKVEAELVEALPDARGRTLDDFSASWDRMVERGMVELKVPSSRPAGVKTMDLSDEELERVSGGDLTPGEIGQMASTGEGLFETVLDLILEGVCI